MLRLFRLLLASPKRFELVSVRALVWVWILRLKHHFWHLAYRTFHLVVSARRKKTNLTFPCLVLFADLTITDIVFEHMR